MTLVLLVGCSTTLYKPAREASGRLTYGYVDYQVGPSRWHISYRRRAGTGRQLIERYLLLRASEIALAHGCSYFRFAGDYQKRDLTIVKSVDVDRVNEGTTMECWQQEPDLVGTIYDAALINQSLSKMVEEQRQRAEERLRRKRKR